MSEGSEGHPTRPTAVLLRYPMVTLFVADMLTQGTTQDAFKSFYEHETTAGWYLMGVFGLLLVPFGLMTFTVHKIKRGLVGNWAPYKTSHLKWWQQKFLPRGVWLPESETVQYGLIYADSMPTHKLFYVASLAYKGLLGFVTSLSPSSLSACHGQAGAVAASSMVMAIIIVAWRPHRCEVMSMLTAAVHVLQSVIIASCVMSEDVPSALAWMETATLLMFAVLTAQGLLSVYHFYWEYHQEGHEVAGLEPSRSTGRKSVAFRAGVHKGRRRRNARNSQWHTERPRIFREASHLHGSSGRTLGSGGR